MVFADLFFLSFYLPVCLMLYFATRSIKVRNAVLIMFSLVFYAWGDPRSLPLLVGTALLIWLCGLGITEGTEKLRRFCFAAALTLLIGSLFLFKYLNFFADTLQALTGIGFSLRRLALPAAISFTTFQLLSYVIDLKRGTVAPEKSFFRFLLYVSFFPQLMQGPIVRYGQISGELSVRQHSWDNALAGAKRFVCGLAKKVLLADSLAALVGLPVYFFTRGAIGNSAAVLLMIGLMMPFFFFAMYERDGQPAEKLLKNRLRYKLWPKNRPYRTENLYKSISKKEVSQIAKNQTAGGAGKTSAKKCKAGKKDPRRSKKGRK